MQRMFDICCCSAIPWILMLLLPPTPLRVYV